MKKLYSDVKRRGWLRLLGAAAVGGGGVYAYLEGVPSQIGGTELPSGDPLLTTFPLNSVFHELRWDDTGQISLHFVEDHGSLGFTISREDQQPIEDSLYSGDSPATSGPVKVDMSNVVKADGVNTYQLSALGGDLESLFERPEIVSTVTFETPTEVVENL